MADLDLFKLREIAEKATEGPWEHREQEAWGEIYDEISIQPVQEIDDSEEAHVSCAPLNETDAAHIAAFDPPTVLALIDEVERLRVKLERITEISVVAQRDCDRLWGVVERERERIARAIEDAPVPPGPPDRVASWMFGIQEAARIARDVGESDE